MPAGRIYRAPDMLADPHFAARRSIVDVPHPQFARPEDAGRVSRVCRPRKALCGGRGQPLGAHNDEVYGMLLGLDAATRAELSRDGII